jgi:hypothetical protein
MGSTPPRKPAAHENFLTNTGIYAKQYVGLWLNQMALTPKIEEVNGNPLKFTRM